MKKITFIMNKFLVFIKNTPIYLLINWICCLISVILNIVAIFTNNNTLRLIAWLFIIIQFSCILIQSKIYKIDMDIIKEENIFNTHDSIRDMNKYKIEYRDKLSLINRIKMKFSNKK